MESFEKKKVALLYVLKILEKYSDCDHVLTQEDIVSYLRKDYGLEIDRRAVARNLEILRDARYDIVTEPHKGVYLGDRLLEDSELRLLIDSVLFSKNIPAKHSEDLIRKLKSLGTDHFGKSLKSIHNVRSIGRVSTPELFYTIDVLNNAIANDRQVQFMYNEYGVDKRLHSSWEKAAVVNPYQLIAANNNYYLVGNIEGEETLSNFRLDKISEITDIDKPRRNIRETKEGGIDLGKYISSHPFMSEGSTTSVTVRVREENIDCVIDGFGLDYQILDNDLKTVDVCFIANKDDALQWALMNAEKVEVLAPQSLREDLRFLATKMRERYLKNEKDKYTLAIEQSRRFGTLRLRGIKTGGKREHETLKRSIAVTFTETDINNISFLKDFTKLQWLDIADCPINDLSPLKVCKYKYLDLRRLPIKNVDFLIDASVDSLTLADLAKVEDYSGLYKMKSLKRFTTNWWTKLKIDLKKLEELYPGIEIIETEKVSKGSISYYGGIPFDRKDKYPLNVYYEIVGKDYRRDFTKEELDAMELLLKTVLNEHFSNVEIDIVERLYKNVQRLDDIAKDYGVNNEVVERQYQEIVEKLQSPGIMRIFGRAFICRD